MRGKASSSKVTSHSNHFSMFLVQSTTPDSRTFLTYINGYQARLAKTWSSVPNSTPDSLNFQGLPTMSYIYRPGTNYTSVQWTTSQVLLTKVKHDTYVHLGPKQGGNLYTDPTWVRSVQVVLQDNPIYAASGFDWSSRPIISLDHIKPRPAVFRWTTGTLIEIIPTIPIGPPQPTITIASPTTINKRDDNDNNPDPAPKKPRRSSTPTGGRGT